MSSDHEDFEDLAKKVYHYRMAGESIPDIAEKLGLDLRTTAKLQRAYSKRLIRYDASTTTKAMELDRMDALMASHWPIATQHHQREAVVGSGPNAHIEMITAPPDVQSAKLVLEVIKQRSRLMGWDVPDPVDHNTIQNILIVGNSQREFLEALEAGRQTQENVLEGQVIE